MEKTNHMFLTKCILHMCEASVFPAGVLERVGCCSLGISSPGYNISCLWPGQVQCHTALTSCCGLCMVGTGGLCVVCPPTHLLRVLQISLRQKVVVLPCLAGVVLQGKAKQ